MSRLFIGFLIIGDEILSGRAADKNLPVLIEKLAAKGLGVCEARIISDDVSLIAEALTQMRISCDYVFTSGGIGPTHDDVTIEGIAKSFDKAVEENKAAKATLANFYQQRGLTLTSARRRMARAPIGATILKSRFLGAPGFIVENVFVCAGVPDIFSMMIDAAIEKLPEFPRRHSITLRVDGPESEIAEKLAEVQRQWAELKIGSYPGEENGKYFCDLVFIGDDLILIKQAIAAISQFLAENNILHRQI